MSGALTLGPLARGEVASNRPNPSSSVRVGVPALPPPSPPAPLGRLEVVDAQRLVARPASAFVTSASEALSMDALDAMDELDEMDDGVPPPPSGNSIVVAAMDDGAPPPPSIKPNLQAKKMYVGDVMGADNAMPRSGGKRPLPKNDSGRYTCSRDGCEKTFVRSSSLWNHLHGVHGEPKFKCEHEGCGKSFRRNGDLKVHKATVHGGETPPPTRRKGASRPQLEHKCPVAGCMSSFEQKHGLARHTKNVHGAKNIVCTHPGCTKRFSRNYDFHSHLRNAHSDKKEFSCDREQCGANFKTKSQLTRHFVEVHGDPKTVQTGVWNRSKKIIVGGPSPDSLVAGLGTDSAEAVANKRGHRKDTDAASVSGNVTASGLTVVSSIQDAGNSAKRRAESDLDDDGRGSKRAKDDSLQTQSWAASQPPPPPPPSEPPLLGHNVV